MATRRAATWQGMVALGGDIAILRAGAPPVNGVRGLPARYIPAMLLARVATLALVALAASSARAQDASAVARDSLRADSLRGDSLRARRIAPVIVTALRGAVLLATVPFAVTVREGDALGRGRPGLALDEALRTVPGVQVDDRHNYAIGERIAVRGFGARAQFGVRGVRVIVDGVPATLPDGQTNLNHLDLGALRRVEVLAGPASALYGNASGGVILLETEGAPLSPRGQVATTAGAHGFRRASLRGGSGAGSLAYGGALSRLTTDGWREHSSARSTWASARLGWERGNDQLRASVTAVDYEARNPGSLSDSLMRVDRRQAFANNVRQRTGEEGRQAQLGASWRRALGSAATARELELSGYLLRRELDNPIPARVITLARDGGGLRALLRDGGAAGVRWTAGLEADAQRDDRQNHLNEEGARGDLVLDQLERVASIGAFAQASGAVAPRLELLGGMRWDRVRFAVADRFVAGGDPDDSGERWMGAVSPSAGAALTLRDGLVLYANAATAFETPTTTELANRESGAGGFNDDLQPQRTHSYEAGARGRLPLDGAFQLSAYVANVRDALIPFEVPDTPGRQFFRNAGRTRHRGIEAAASLSPLAALRLDAGYTRIDARFTDYAVGDAVRDGNRVPGIAPWRLEGSATLGLPAGISAGVDTRLVARTPADDANSAEAPGYAVTDARIAVDDIGGGPARARVFGGVENLFAREYVGSVVVNAFGRRYFEPAPGRAVYVGVELTLGR